MPQQLLYVVDDDLGIRNSLRVLFDAHGLSAEFYSDGRVFLQDLDTNASGCLVLDVNMPGIDGFGVLQALSHSKSSLKVILITGRADNEARARAAQAGVVAFVQKPYSSRELVEKIRTALTP